MPAAFLAAGVSVLFFPTVVTPRGEEGPGRAGRSHAGLSVSASRNHSRRRLAPRCAQSHRASPYHIFQSLLVFSLLKLHFFF